MLIKTVTPQLSVSVQIQPEDISAIRSAGFKSMICNRPNGEEPGQPCFSLIQAEAKAQGLDVCYQPVTAGKLTDTDAQEFERHVNSLPGPVLAYCRTGTRSISLWAMAASKTQSKRDVIATANEAGYDVSKIL